MFFILYTFIHKSFLIGPICQPHEKCVALPRNTLATAAMASQLSTLEWRHNEFFG